MKLYKFRPLGDDLSFCRAKEILRTGRFWCSRFWELNDPMEGVYLFTAADGVSPGEVFSGKARYVICSFSGEEAFSDPAIWGYYANGFRGVAIEIEIEMPDDEITEMNYVKDVEDLPTKDELPATDEQVKEILRAKLDRWKHEHEFRFLRRSEEPAAKQIGEIKAVHFGDPYGNTANPQDIVDNSPGLRTFRSQRYALQALAKEEDIDCYFVTVSKGRVRSVQAEAK